MSGIQGRLNKQFAITIAISVMISAFNALTLSPALAAMLLRPRKRRGGLLGGSFAVFNRGFDEGDARGYVGVSRVPGREKLVIGVGILVAFAGRGGVSSGGGCPPASCRRKTTDTSLSTCSFPPAASLAAHRRGRAEDRRGVAHTPRASLSFNAIVGFSLL